MIKNIRELSFGDKQASSYAFLVKRLESFNVGSETTIQLALGQDIWGTLSISERISLGKLVKHNIASNKLFGLLPIDTKKGQNQLYRITEPVVANTVFHAPILGVTDCLTSALELTDGDTSTALVKATAKVTDDGLLLGITVYRVSSNTKVFTDSRLLGDDFFTYKNLRKDDKEIGQVLALWYAYDRLFANKDVLKDLDLLDIHIVISLDLIDKSVADYSSIGNKSFEYEDFIRCNFIQFARGNLRSIPFNISLMGVCTPLDILYN